MVRECDRTTSGIGRSGVSDWAWRIWAALGSRSRSSPPGSSRAPAGAVGRARQPRIRPGATAASRRQRSPRSERRSRPARRPPWMGRRIQARDHAAKRVAGQHEGAGGAGRPQQGVEVANDVPSGPRHRHRVASAQRVRVPVRARAVIGHTGETCHGGQDRSPRPDRGLGQIDPRSPVPASSITVDVRCRDIRGRACDHRESRRGPRRGRAPLPGRPPGHPPSVSAPDRLRPMRRKSGPRRGPPRATATEWTPTRRTSPSWRSGHPVAFRSSRVAFPAFVQHCPSSLDRPYPSSQNPRSGKPRGIRMLIPPDAGKHRRAQTGWDRGRYPVHAGVLETDREPPRGEGPSRGGSRRHRPRTRIGWSFESWAWSRARNPCAQRPKLDHLYHVCASQVRRGPR